ncbi:MAG TPA: hypothetical protein PKD51_06345 [Saprospiraceae bacterium]|nr:hypothetical protein [Saprospiraceae bacterium]
MTLDSLFTELEYENLIKINSDFDNLPLFHGIRESKIEEFLDSEYEIGNEKCNFLDEELAYFYIGRSAYVPPLNENISLIIVLLPENIELKFASGSDSGIYKELFKEKKISIPGFISSDDFKQNHILTRFQSLNYLLQIIYNNVNNYIEGSIVLRYNDEKFENPSFSRLLNEKIRSSKNIQDFFSQLHQLNLWYQDNISKIDVRVVTAEFMTKPMKISVNLNILSLRVDLTSYYFLRHKFDKFFTINNIDRDNKRRINAVKLIDEAFGQDQNKEFTEFVYNNLN